MIQQLRQALDHIDVVMGFLSAGGKENPNMSLNHYATKVLKIQDFNKVVSHFFYVVVFFVFFCCLFWLLWISNIHYELPFTFMMTSKLGCNEFICNIVYSLMS